MTKTPTIIYGVGGFGREVAWLIDQCADAGQNIEPVCFVDDNSAYHGSIVNNLPVLSLADAAQRYPHAAIAGGGRFPGSLSHDPAGYRLAHFAAASARNP